MLTGGETGPAVVPGRPEDSELIRRITAVDDDDVMPPSPRKRLAEEEIEAMRQWILAGALWDAAAAESGQKNPD